MRRVMTLWPIPRPEVGAVRRWMRRSTLEPNWAKEVYTPSSLPELGLV